ncbi:ABC transporter ATP-binding protein [Alteromonas facilis]|uniref:ABC transporter ATP-binding protein n=1 Tax=Alteromonas facilis TaxID=2048004 RepID=UPI000C2878FE|nr:ABC transporter ATP-binding protein [Alteromonas facilis]
MHISPRNEPETVFRLENLVVDARLEIPQLDIPVGSLVQVLGANGSGKSTLLLSLAGLITPTNGTVLFRSQALSEWTIAELATTRSYLAQELHSEFSISVAEYLTFFSSQPALPDAVEQSLSVSQFLQKPLVELSGGERQRVHLARCLMQVWSHLEAGNGVLLLDEPLQGLDIVFQYKVMVLLQTLQKKGNCIVMSCHDVNMAAKYSSHAILLDKGNVLAHGPTSSAITTENLSTCFGCKFHLIYTENAYEFFASGLNSRDSL